MQKRGKLQRMILDGGSTYSHWEALKLGDDLVFEMICGQDTSEGSSLKFFFGLF